MSSHFNIGKKDITIQDLFQIIFDNKKIKLSKDSQSCIINSRNYLSEKIKTSSELIYGVNTGFGSLCDTKINEVEINKLQENLILSHACGVGEKVPEKIVKIILLLKIRSLSLGYSAVRLELILLLIDLYNYKLNPVLYQQGSLGASGDLAPLANLSLPLIGRGEVYLGDQIVSTQKAFHEFNLKPIKLSLKEGLALLNGTQFMTGYGVWSLIQAKKIFYLSTLISCISLEAFSCNHSPFIDLIAKIRPHFGQLHTSQIVNKILSKSKSFFSNQKHVQDPYSFRCIPQVHGASFDVIKHVESVFNIEVNSVTDNPNVFYHENKIISAGNFHGQPLALSLDYLALALCELANISERRVFQLLSGQRNLPPYLIENPGLNSGFMITQYTAASIVSQNKQYATPASVDSIVSSNGQEDHVSMGANSATKLYKIVQNVYTVLAIELLNAAQAIELKKTESSPILKYFLKQYRKEVPFIHKDEQLNLHINKTREFISEFNIYNLLDLDC
ncbi:MAG: histidine ammonia-lyase [Flavobacteriales bacterium]|nr:histidine ammonia-lyase [Flavobacteriales bacterium]|tara:strand:- start:24655 stop:26166 length:1512 start_codon:yes stop_codon:yes gene_type:complete